MRLRPDHHSGDVAEVVLRPGNDRVFLCAPDSHLRLPQRGQSRCETRFGKTMEGIAAENGIEIELVQSKKSFRKEQRVNEILEKRGKEPGLGWIVPTRSRFRSRPRCPP